MTDVIVLGAIGLDDLKTPHGEAKNVLGGSAPYAACGASFFAKTGIISVKGEDLPEKELEFLKEKGVSLEGVKTKGKNFRWAGEYKDDMNQAKTILTQLNSLENFEPEIPEAYKNAKYVFLSNMDPEQQIKVIDSVKSPELIVIDTMNFWINNKKEKLTEAIKKSDILILNDSEARQLFNTHNLVTAAKRALELNLKAVIIKKGEHGSLLFTKNEHFNCPGYPSENVIDPTGCGDVFGGAFIGHYSKNKDIRKAMVYASVVASYNAEGFGTENLKKLSIKDIEKRYKEMRAFREF